MERIQVADGIYYWKASEDPLSADVSVIQGADAVWIFDVGNDPKVAEEIEAIPGKKNIVLSHFHADHIGNLPRIHFDQLYQGSHTMKYTNTGIVVKNSLWIEDGVRLHLFELPSSHAKGSIGLEVNEEYAFLGDAVYCMTYKGRAAYNTQLLLAELRMLKSLKAPYVLMSHDDPFVQKRSDVIAHLEKIYEKRQQQEAYIYLE